jgi:GNAT superfamily N-acetyltransferase
MLRKLHPNEVLHASVIPAPYRLVHYAAGDEERWLELLNATNEFGVWDQKRLSHELLSTLLADGGIFVAYEDRLVGCASACLMPEYKPYAILMYVTLLPEHRGKGLGQALVWETMRVAQCEKFPGLLLHTEAHRYAAVRTYFQLGFLPQVGEETAGKRVWSNVLGHALLNGFE